MDISGNEYDLDVGDMTIEAGPGGRSSAAYRFPQTGKFHANVLPATDGLRVESFTFFAYVKAPNQSAVLMEWCKLACAFPPTEAYKTNGPVVRAELGFKDDKLAFRVLVRQGVRRVYPVRIDDWTFVGYTYDAPSKLITTIRDSSSFSGAPMGPNYPGLQTQDVGWLYVGQSHQMDYYRGALSCMGLADTALDMDTIMRIKEGCELGDYSFMRGEWNKWNGGGTHRRRNHPTHESGRHPDGYGFMLGS